MLGVSNSQFGVDTMNRRRRKHLKEQRDSSKQGRNTVQVRLDDLVKTQEVQAWLDRKVASLKKVKEQ